MARPTITLPDDLQRAVKEQATRRGTTIGRLIAESLMFHGVKPQRQALELVSRARRNAVSNEAEALELALQETAIVRQGVGSPL